MPSFDIVSKIDKAEVDNAWTQAKKELEQRYDFKGTGTAIDKDEKTGSLVIKTNSEMKLDSAWEVLGQKLAKRGIPLRGVTRGDIEKAGGTVVKQTVTFQQGIPVEKGKEIVKLLKDSKIKVQAAIQGEELRVSGKNRDDLQAAMQLIRGQAEALSVDVQFTNFRD